MNKKVVVIIEIAVVIGLIPFVYKTWKNFFNGLKELNAMDNQTEVVEGELIINETVGGIEGTFTNTSGSVILSKDGKVVLDISDCNNSPVFKVGTYTVSGLNIKVTVNDTNETVSFEAGADQSLTALRGESICFTESKFNKS